MPSALANSDLVGEALVRYVNSGVTLGAVNMPEVNLRSLTLDERDHARVSKDRAETMTSPDNDRLSISIAMCLVCLEKVKFLRLLYISSTNRK